MWLLFYQDFNEQFEGYTQPASAGHGLNLQLFYQDFNEQFEGYTQPTGDILIWTYGCFIRISMNNSKDIHNYDWCENIATVVVLSGFQ